MPAEGRVSRCEELSGRLGPGPMPGTLQEDGVSPCPERGILVHVGAGMGNCPRPVAA